MTENSGPAQRDESGIHKEIIWWIEGRRDFGDFPGLPLVMNCFQFVEIVNDLVPTSSVEGHHF